MEISPLFHKVAYELQTVVEGTLYQMGTTAGDTSCSVNGVLLSESHVDLTCMMLNLCTQNIYNLEKWNVCSF